MATQDSATHEEYYVPESSGMALSATFGLIMSIFGAASVLNDMTFGEPDAATSSSTILMFGLFWFIGTLFVWFRTAIRENLPQFAILQSTTYVPFNGSLLFFQITPY